MAGDLDLATCDKLLTTTRSVRLRFDLNRPVEPELIEQCLEIALQAPSQTNTQQWHFVVITDAAKRAALADIYRRSFESYWQASVAKAPEAFENPSKSVQRMIESAEFLTANLQDVPVHVLFCSSGDLVNLPLFEQASAYGSIIPAAWSFMLAARARGIGCCWTTVHLMDAAAAADVLGLPADVTQAALLPVAYYKGRDFKLAERLPLRDVMHWNSWGEQRSGD
ncbi:MAG: nitroreductase [Gammaproteobacteria bacterium]|jgi:nitroreductase